MNTSALTHTGVHSSIHIGVKQVLTDTIVLICCCFKTYFVILVMCAASIIFNI